VKKLKTIFFISERSLIFAKILKEWNRQKNTEGFGGLFALLQLLH
jgi:hypothetical protein